MNELDKAIKELLAIPCKVEAANRTSFDKQVAALKLKDEPEAKERLEKLLATGPEVCEGQWCEARKKIAASWQDYTQRQTCGTGSD